MFKITQKQAQYLKANFRKFSDKRLAKALTKDKSWIKGALGIMRLQRNKEDTAYIQKHPSAIAPKFDAASSIPVFYLPKFSIKNKLILSLSFLFLLLPIFLQWQKFLLGKEVLS